MSSNSTFGSKMSLIRPSKGGGVGHGRTGGQPGLGGCRGLISDPNDKYEDILEVMTIFVILRQNDYFETFALSFHQLF